MKEVIGSQVRSSVACYHIHDMNPDVVAEATMCVSAACWVNRWLIELLDPTRRPCLPTPLGSLLLIVFFLKGCLQDTRLFLAPVDVK